MKKPKAILFDFGDTVLHEVYFKPLQGDEYLLSISDNPRNISYTELAEYSKDLVEVFRDKRYESQLEHTWHSFNGLLFDKFGITFNENINTELEFWKHSVKMVIAPGITDALEYLKDNRIRTGIISNNIFSSSVIEWELNRFDLMKYFEFVISSADYGIRKPHPLIFKTGAARLDLPEEEVWYAGNSYEHDVVGSKNSRMTPVYYTGNNKGDTHMYENIIYHWHELIRILVNLK